MEKDSGSPGQDRSQQTPPPGPTPFLSHLFLQRGFWKVPAAWEQSVERVVDPSSDAFSTIPPPQIHLLPGPCPRDWWGPPNLEEGLCGR